MKKYLLVCLIILFVGTVSAALQIQNLNVEEKDDIVIGLSFYEDYQPTTAIGNAKIRILNDEGLEVYKGEFKVSEADYKQLALPYSDSTYNGVEMKISIDMLAKSKASASGTLFLDFYQGETLIDSRDMGLYKLPKFSEKELASISEEEYIKIAKPLEFSGRTGDLLVKVTRYGLYKDYDYQVTSLLRVDFEVENLKDVKESVSLYGSSALDEKGVQHQYSYSTPVSTVDIFPGEKKEGFVLFSDYSDAKLSTVYLGGDIIADMDKGTISTIEEKKLIDFHESSKKLNRTLKIDKFVEVMLVEYGDIKLGTEDYLAFSINVKNIGISPLDYAPGAIVLTVAEQTVSEETIYESTFKDVFRSGTILPGASESGTVFFKKTDAKELLINSGYAIVQGEKEMGDAEQVTYNNFYVFKFALDGKQKKPSSGTFKIEWDMLGVIGLAITVLSIVAGWWISKVRRKETIKFIDAIDDIYHKYNTQQAICISQLNEVKKQLKDEFNKGQIDNENLNLLMDRIDKHMDELKK